MLCFLSANGARGSRWYLGMDRDNTERGKVVKCSRHTNNTSFVVRAARGLKKISERCRCSSCGLSLFQENVWFDKVNRLGGCLWLMSCSFTVHIGREEGVKGRRTRRCRDEANYMGRRGGEWLSLVQVNERRKHKEALHGWVGVARTGGTDKSNHHLQLHVLISIAAVAHTLLPTNPANDIKHNTKLCNSPGTKPAPFTVTYITLIQLPTNSYPLQKCYSITAWLGESRRALDLAKTDTLAAKYFACHNVVEEDVPDSLFTGSRDVLWSYMKDWMVTPASPETQLIMSAFVPACQGCTPQHT